jgi:hypothetical protein
MPLRKPFVVHSAKFGITIEDHVAVGPGFAEGLPQLLRNPRASGIFCHIKMQDLAAAVFDDEETIQVSEG